MIVLVTPGSVIFWVTVAELMMVLVEAGCVMFRVTVAEWIIVLVEASCVMFLSTVDVLAVGVIVTVTIEAEVVWLHVGGLGLPHIRI
jgi:hypothetical protein